MTAPLWIYRLLTLSVVTGSIVYYLTANRFDPASQVPRFEHTVYCVAWVLLAYRSFSDRRSGFPPYLIPFNWSWEFLAILFFFHHNPQHVFIPDAVRFGFVLWFLLSTAHLWAVACFSSHEFRWGPAHLSFWSRMAFSIACCLLVFGGSIFLPGGEGAYFSVVGYAMVTVISFNFMLMALYRKDLVGIGLVGNLLRIWAQHLTLIGRPEDSLTPLYPVVLRTLTYSFDLVFLAAFVVKAKREGWRPFLKI